MRIDLQTSLVDALGISPGDLVSIVGAGGKTSLMYSLGREISSGGNLALLTTTTRVMYPGKDQVEEVILGPESEATVARVRQNLRRSNLVLAGRKRTDSKIIGFSPAFVERLCCQDRVCTVITECDGAKGRSLKVPRESEPPLASSTKVYVVVVGADCIGKCIGSKEVFDPEGVAFIAGVGLNSKVDQQVIVKTVLSPKSYLGKKPDGARLCVFINKVDTRPLEPYGAHGDGEVAPVLNLGLALKRDAAVERVVFGSLRPAKPRAFLVLR